MHILLSSGSPRRKELLKLMGLSFEVRVPITPEVQLAGERPSDFCARVSEEKAREASREHPDSLVIGADTVVVQGGEILGKPRDHDEARRYLVQLQNSRHDVLTGYTITYRGESVTRVITTAVHFRAMTDDEISWYIATGEPMDKAGAYALQGAGSLFIDRIEGSYTNVIGLPVSELYQDLKGFGLSVDHMRGGTFA
ncbi:MAG: Maf family protein [Desulfomonilia bacterium]|nr:Maf family protein [Desulfomonilia bacterium]